MVAQQNVETPETQQNDKVTVKVPKDIIWHFLDYEGADLAYYIDRSSSTDRSLSRVYKLDEFLDTLQISVYSLPTDSLEDAVRHILKSIDRCPNCGGVHAIVGIFERKPDGIREICAPAVEEECIKNVRKLESSGSLGLSL